MKRNLLKASFKEEFADLGDITEEAIFSDEIDKFKLFSKDSGILSGINEFIEVKRSIDDSITSKIYYPRNPHRNFGNLMFVSSIICSTLDTKTSLQNYALRVLNNTK